MHSVELVEVSVTHLESVEPLLCASPFKPYRFVHGIGAPELVAFWFETAAEQSRSGTVVVCRRDSRIVGLAILNELVWESDVIGQGVWGISQLVAAPGESDVRDILDRLIDRVLILARERGADTIHCKRFSDDMTACQALQRRGFLLVDTQLVYGFEIGGSSQRRMRGDKARSGVLRLAQSADLEELVDVARASFKNHYGRFHSDQRLPAGSAIRVYEEWVRSSIRGYADWIVVAEIGGRLAAYSIWRKPAAREAKLSKRIGHYSIGAVHPDFLGQGLFTEVTRRGLELFDGVADCVVGPTHVNNYGVQRGYTRLGWHILDATHTFHAWLS